jgi:aminopeptidase N
MINVSNGRLRSATSNGDGTTTYEWFVANPINNYAIAVGAGSYAHFADTMLGGKGPLTLDFWPLDYNLDAARRQFAQVEPVIACFEHWFGPYPWYEDGFKLVETPHPGMEHQSAVAYGNHYANGYRGRDPSGVGIGLEWDFIIVHETAHEWFANNITTKDLADMWVHESFGNYAENLYEECRSGKERGAQYVIGTRRGIGNERPIVPPAYGVNAQGSGDMYPKGGNMLHTIRQIVGDDEKWRAILRGLNATFGRKTIMGSDVEAYIAHEAGRDLSRVFDQYLRTTKIPVLEYRMEGETLSYRWADVVPGFDMPVEVTVAGEGRRLQPMGQWQTLEAEVGGPKALEVDPDYYVIVREIEEASPDR